MTREIKTSVFHQIHIRINTVIISIVKNHVSTAIITRAPTPRNVSFAFQTVYKSNPFWPWMITPRTNRWFDGSIGLECSRGTIVTAERYNRGKQWIYEANLREWRRDYSCRFTAFANNRRSDEKEQSRT